MSKNDEDEQQSDITNLQDNFTKQQEKISALKELVRKSEVAHGKSTSSAQEKVKNIAQRLTILKSIARSRHSLDLSQQDATTPDATTTTTSKVMMMMSPGDTSTSLSLSQAQLSASNFSTPNPSPLKPTTTHRTDSTSSSSITLPMTTPGSEKFLLLRKQMEQNKAKIAEREHSKREIEQLVTQLKAKFDTTQQCLEHSTELGRSMSDLSSLAYTPVSRDRHKSVTDISTAPFNLDKERIKFLDNRVRLLEKQLEKEKQNSIRESEGGGHAAAAATSSLKRVKELENKIQELEESLKEKHRTDQLMANLNDHQIEESWQIENARLKTELEEKSRRITSLEEVNDILETTKCDLTLKTSELEANLKEQQERCLELEKANSVVVEGQKFEIINREDVEEDVATANEMISQIQLLQEQINQLESDNAELKRTVTTAAESQTQPKLTVSDENVAERIASLEATIQSQNDDIQQHLQHIKKLEEDFMEKTIELNVLTANYAVLEEKLKETNRSKPLFSAIGSDATDYLRAQEEITKLKRQLEEENKNEMFSIDADNTRVVASQMESIKLEEQVTMLKATIKSLEQELQANLRETERYSLNFIELQAEKDATDKKLEHYIAENMELLDKVEKLSKSSSSAESIEIVERLTQQERAEIDAFNKQLDREHEEDMKQSQQQKSNATFLDASTTTTTNEVGQELSDSLIQLREESSELMNKIELFTTERREVLEKMEALKAENQEHIQKIERLLEEKDNLETSSLLAANERDQLQKQFDIVTKQKDLLTAHIAQIAAEKEKIALELCTLSRAASSTPSLPPGDSATLLEKCEKSLIRLNTELESYRKATDKNAKFNASKKLCKEAKNAHQQLTMLMKQVKEAATTTAAPLPEVAETPAVNYAAAAENIELNARCTELQSTVEDLRRELEEARLTAEERTAEVVRLNGEIAGLKVISDDFDRLINDKEMEHEKQIEHLTRLRRELEAKCDTCAAEIEILQALIVEQKQQLIESYKESEEENNKKLREFQQRDDTITQLRQEIKNIQDNSSHIGEQYYANLLAECEKLREAQKINKSLLAEQIDDLSNKQETIETLNTQIMDLYKTMEENANKVIEKEDEVVYLQEIIDSNKVQIDNLHRENTENKASVEKLLDELHSLKITTESQLNKLPTLEADNQRLQQSVKDLEHRNKEQLEKLKKYAANLKRRAVQCHEFEEKIKHLEKGAIEAATQIKENPELVSEQVQSLEVSLQRAENDLKNSNDKLQSLQVELQQAQGKITSLEEALQSAQLAIDEAGDWNAGEPSMETINAQLQDDLLRRTRDVDRLEQEVSMRSSEIDNLNGEIAAKTTSLQKAQDALDEIQDELLTLHEEERERNMRTKDLSEELEVKTEQLAALKKQMASSDEMHGGELLTLKEQIREHDIRAHELTEELRAKSIKFEKSKAVIKEKNREIQRLTRELAELNQKLNSRPEEEPQAVAIMEASASAQSAPTAMADDYDALKDAHVKLIDEYAAEKRNFEETISRLETLHDGIQAKLQEDMSYIESIELENSKFKERILKLEECVGSFEERRASMERRENLLDAQMQLRADEYEKTEDALVYRLNMLSNHDEVIAQRLLDSQEEKEELTCKLEQLCSEHAALTTKHTKLEREFANFKEETTTAHKLESQTLREQMAASDAETNRMRSSYEAKLSAKNTEIDELESDLSEQFRKIEADRRNLQEDLERARDEIAENKNELCRLKEALNSLEQSKNDLERENTWIKMQNDNLTQDQFELQELRMQSMQDKTELENLRHQIEAFTQNHEIELNALRTQISELDTLRMQVGQNQTDDQVFIETENKRLTDLLAEKETLIENYQRQNLQLQMSSLAMSANAGTATDPFTPVAPAGQSATDAARDLRSEHLERELAEKSEIAARAMRDFAALQTEFHSLVEANAEMQHQLAERQRTNSDVIPAPPMFFATEQIAPSPFDEIVSAPRHMDHRLESINPASSTVQPTIEDLQRNVSDLEKHAQDLENKLAMRIVMHEDVQRRLEELLRTSEAQSKEYEERLLEIQKKQLAVEQRLQEMQQREAEKALEMQIIEVSNPTEQTLAPSLDMFFRGPLPPTASQFEDIFTSKQPPQEVSSEQSVIEEMIVPKKSYVCYPSENLTLDLGEDWGEGWGSNAAEAVLDDQHFAATPASTSLVPVEQQLEIKLQESNERIQELELERDRLDQQKQEMQVKSGKLMKKLKEYKAKIDQLNSQTSFRKSSSVESASNDLDLAIQEELNSQVSQLETKLIEARKVVDGQTAEKENLLKRIDVLTAGNDRMAEMKERQDNDVKMYQARIRELSEKLRTLEEWEANTAAPITPITSSTATDQEFAAKVRSDLEKRIAELTAEIADISGDKAELQAMLDEEKSNAERTENTIRTLNVKIVALENSASADNAADKSKYNELKLQHQNLLEQCNDLREAQLQMTTQIESITSENRRKSADLERLTGELGLLSARNQELFLQSQEVQQANHSTREELNTLSNNHQELLRKHQELQTLLNESQDSIDLAGFEQRIQELTMENDALQKALTAATHENQQFAERAIQLATQKEQQEHQVEQLAAQNAQQERQIEELSAQNLVLQQAASAATELEQANSNLLKKNAALIKDLEKLQNERKLSSGEKSDELEEQLQEKDSEITHLKQRIEDLMREDQTEKLVLEILTKNQEIHMLKMQVKHLEDDKQDLEHNLSMQLTREMEQRKVESTASTADNNLQQQRIAELEKSMQELQAEKANMEAELNVLNNHVMSSLEMEDKLKVSALELDAKNIEIFELRKSLEAVKVSSSAAATATVETQSDDQTEALVEQKCYEIAQMWREHLEAREAEFKRSENKLQQEIESLRSATSLPQPASADDTPPSTSSSTSSTSAAQSKQGTPVHQDATMEAALQKMQSALESQEIEIITLKEQLAIRSAEYARLAAQYDPFKMQSTLSHSGVNSSSGGRNAATADGSAVPKSELDLALYMLHQRDMRCEEMTLELVSLLEERDTLQLKLSNTLRQVEAIKSQTNYVEPPQSDAALASTSDNLDEKSSVLNTSGQIFAVAGAGSDQSDELTHKLSQLQTVSHSRDKRFQEEREQRNRQMEKMQQDVAKMPSEALSELVGSDMSLSSLSPSTVLMNWLWGKPNNSPVQPQS